jgi:hypothetical protein
MWEVPSIEKVRASVERAKGLRDAVQTSLKKVRNEISELEGEEELLTLVSELFRQLINNEITTGVKAVERLQEEGLKTVFSDLDLAVQAAVKVQRGQVSVDLVTVEKKDDGTVVEGLSNDSFGGSVTTVQSVLLRILLILRRDLRPVLVMDESLPAFDPNYVHDMGQFLSLICARLGLDILLVTQNPAMVEAADRAYRIARSPDGAKFERAK